MKTFTKGAKSDISESGLSQIPFVSLLEIGKRFRLGELKYGRDNWKSGDAEWMRERDEHALLHMMYILHGGGEDSLIGNLAAVAWWAIIKIWHESRVINKTVDKSR